MHRKTTITTKRLLYSCIVFSLFFLSNTHAENIESNPHKLDSILQVHKGLYFKNPTTMGSKDSIYRSRDGYSQMLYYDSDSLFRQFIRKGREGVADEFHCYYGEIIVHLPMENRLQELEKMKYAAQKYKSSTLAKETKLLELEIILKVNDDSLFATNLKRGKEIAHEFALAKDTFYQINVLGLTFRYLYERKLYPEAFELARQVLRIMDDVSKEQVSIYGGFYYYIGEAYYHFGEYEEAISCLKKAVAPARHFGNRQNLQSLNALGLYYRTNNYLATSDSCFRAMLESKDIVKFRRQYDAIAICNLGRNYLIRKEYQKAVALWEKGLPPMLEAQDYNFAAGVTIGLGNCYLALGDLSRTKDMIDSAKIYIALSKSTSQNIFLYPLMSQYYARTGDGKKASTYTDSLVAASNAYRKEYNASHVLRVEKKMLMAEREVEKQKLDVERLEKEKYRSNLHFSLILLVLLLILLLIYILLYRKKEEAYRTLVVKNQEWANKASIENNASDDKDKNEGSPTPDDQSICKRIQDYLNKEKAYKNPDLTLDSLAEEMDITRNSMSQAINRCTGKNFNRYINEFRIKDSIQLMSDVNHKKDTMEVIAEMAGFNSNSTFYEAFKNITGLTPAQFRRNR